MCPHSRFGDFFAPPYCAPSTKDRKFLRAVLFDFGVRSWAAEMQGDKLTAVPCSEKKS